MSSHDIREWTCNHGYFFRPNGSLNPHNLYTLLLYYIGRYVILHATAEYSKSTDIYKLYGYPFSTNFRILYVNLINSTTLF